MPEILLKGVTLTRDKALVIEGFVDGVAVSANGYLNDIMNKFDESKDPKGGKLDPDGGREMTDTEKRAYYEERLLAAASANQPETLDAHLFDRVPEPEQTEPQA